MDLSLRLDILKEAGQLTEDNFKKIMEIINIIKEEWGILITEENGSMFITHMVMVMDRINKNTTVNSMDDFMKEQICQDENYGEVKLIMGKMKTLLQLDIPENEDAFIEMHLCTLFNKSRK